MGRTKGSVICPCFCTFFGCTTKPIGDESNNPTGPYIIHNCPIISGLNPQCPPNLEEAGGGGGGGFFIVAIHPCKKPHLPCGLPGYPTGGKTKGNKQKVLLLTENGWKKGRLLRLPPGQKKTSSDGLMAGLLGWLAVIKRKKGRGLAIGQRWGDE